MKVLAGINPISIRTTNDQPDLGEENVCLKHRCCSCCNPVKIISWRIINIIEEKLPFIDSGEILIPAKCPDGIRLKSYFCQNLDPDTGRCNDYESRPKICRNTRCAAFETENERRREEIIEYIKSEKYIRLKCNPSPR